MCLSLIIVFKQSSKAVNGQFEDLILINLKFLKKNI